MNDELHELDVEIKKAEDHLCRLRERRRALFEAAWYGGDPTHVKRYGENKGMERS